MESDTGVSNNVIIGVVASCAAPAAILNIWPRIEQMILSGISGNQIGIVILVTMSAVGMAAVPFAMKKAENWGFWSVCLAMGIALTTLNYAMAVGAIGKGRDWDAGQIKELKAKAEGLKAQITDVKLQRQALPPFAWTTPEMVESASSAVAMAVQARDQECGKVGDNCRSRVAQLSSRQGEYANLVQARGYTIQSEKLTVDARRFESELLQIGPVPTYSDAQSARLAKVVSIFISLGDDAIERVADGLITTLAIAAEAFALVMPRILVTAIAGHTGPLAPGAPIPAPARETNGRANPPARNPTPVRSPAIGGTILKGAQGNVENWKRINLTYVKNNRVKAWEVYVSYKSWCELQKLTPIGFSAFDFELQALKIKKESLGGRDFYLEVGLTAPGLKVVA